VDRVDRVVDLRGVERFAARFEGVLGFAEDIMGVDFAASGTGLGVDGF
jgi:hypothetical protein